MATKHLLNLVGNRLHTLPLIVLYITDGCNSRCVTCDIWRSPRKNMDMQLIEKVVTESADLGVRHVLLSGGEAMQHPEWDTIARMFRERGIYTMLLTNGLFLRKQAEQVIINVDEVIVSLDGGTPTTYKAIRGVDAFDLVLDGIRAIAEDVPVITRTTVQRANYRELPQIIDVALDAGVDRASFLAVDVSNPYAFGPRFETDPDLVTIPESPDVLSPADVDALAKIIDTLEIQHADDFATGRIAESPAKLRRILVDYFRGDDFTPPRCNAPHFSTVIEVDGTLRPCYFLPDYGKVVVNENHLRDSINTDTALALRHAYRHGKRKECTRCVCPLYKGVRSILAL